MVETYVWYTLTLFLVLTTCSNAEDALLNQKRKLLSQLDDVRHKLTAVTRSVRNLQRSLDDDHIECHMVAGLSNPSCTLENIDTLQNIQNMIAHGPGKRSSLSSKVLNDNPDAQSLYDDMLRKKQLISEIKPKIEEIINRLHSERKRSCKWNLGFHCQTEEYSSIADMYDWIKSAASPGKRKRRSIIKTLQNK